MIRKTFKEENQVTVESNISMHSAFGKELQSPDLGRFYKRNGHKGRIQPDDLCVWLSNEKHILAAARLSLLNDQGSTTESHLLRGLWVSKQHRGQGFGSRLLKEICNRNKLNQRIYCFSYLEAIPFYKAHGFTTKLDQLPCYLQHKQERYRKRTNTQLMLYTGNGISESSHSM